MGNNHDAYREALVVETATVWPTEYDDMDESTRARFEQMLHAEPESAEELDYVRQHTGFTRQITVTSADVERLS